MYERINGPKRLTFALECAKSNEATLQKLAIALNYLPEQLEQDIDALIDMVDEATQEEGEEA